MPNSTVPLVNGVNYSWANIGLILFGNLISGVVAIDYKAKQKKDNNYGAGIEPVSRGYGMKEYEGSIELYTDVWQSIVAGSPNRDPLQIPMFDIPVTFSGDGVVTTKHVLRAVEFLEDPLSGKSGDTKLLIKIPLIIGAIKK